MENKDFKELITVLYKDFRKYIKLQLDYQRLDAVETIVVFITKIFAFVIILATIIFFTFFLLFGGAFLIGDLLGHDYYGFFIIAFFALFLGGIALLLRKPIFTNPIINALVTAVFSNKKIKKRKKKNEKEN